MSVNKKDFSNKNNNGGFIPPLFVDDMFGSRRLFPIPNGLNYKQHSECGGNYNVTPPKKKDFNKKHEIINDMEFTTRKVKLDTNTIVRYLGLDVNLLVKNQNMNENTLIWLYFKKILSESVFAKMTNSDMSKIFIILLLDSKPSLCDKFKNITGHRYGLVDSSIVNNIDESFIGVDFSVIDDNIKNLIRTGFEDLLEESPFLSDATPTMLTSIIQSIPIYFDCVAGREISIDLLASSCITLDSEEKTNYILWRE